jgi:hypothetical protein
MQCAILFIPTRPAVSFFEGRNGKGTKRSSLALKSILFIVISFGNVILAYDRS